MLATRVSTLALAVVLGSWSAAQSARLNRPLLRDPSGQVSGYALDPASGRAVFRRTGDRFQLLSRPADRSGPAVVLSGTSSGPVWFRLASSGRVVYSANEAGSGAIDLVSVAVDGTGDPIVFDEDVLNVSQIEVSSDGAFCVYARTVAETAKLFRVPVDGSAPPVPLTPAHDVFRFWIDGGASRVVFVEWLPGVALRLLSVAGDGSAAPILIDEIPLPPPAPVAFDDLRFSADASHVVYTRSMATSPRQAELYCAPVDGSQAAVRLNLQTLDDWSCAFAFDGVDRVAYVETSPGTFAGELHSVRIDGTGRVVLSAPGALVDAMTFAADLLAPDGTQLVFASESGGQQGVLRRRLDGSLPAVTLLAPASQTLQSIELLGAHVVALRTAASTSEVVAVPYTGGSGPVVLATVLALPASHPIKDGERSLGVTPDGQTLVLRLALETASATELFAVPIDGSEPPHKLNAELEPGGLVLSFAITSDGTRVLYDGNDGIVDTLEHLFSVPIDGSAPPVALDPPVYGRVVGDVLGYQVATDEQRFVYRADGDVDDVFELYAGTIGAHVRPRRLTESLGTTGDVLDGFAFTPTGERIVFQHQGALFRLFGVSHALAAPPVELDSSAVQFPSPFAFTADGARVIYQKPGGGGPSDFALRSASIDGGAPALDLSDPPGAQTVAEFAVAPSGATVVYTADQDTSGVLELYSIPSDGSGPAIKLNPPLVSGGDVQRLQITPDSSRVVYTANQEDAATVELYSVPVDGSAPAVKLGSPLIAGGTVEEIAIGPDAELVVYRARVATQTRFDLFSVPVDGSAAPVRLTTMPTGSPVHRVQGDFRIGPDAAHVYYRANLASPQELFRVPIDASAGPVKLSGVLDGGGNVLSFAVSPDGSRVVYRADQSTNEHFELFSAPADGSGAPIPLDPLLPGYARHDDYRIDPDSACVVYVRFEANPYWRTDLYSVALDGSTAPKRLHRVLGFQENALSDYVTLSGGAVVYRLEQWSDIFELFRYADIDVPPLLRPLPTDHVVR